MIRTLATASALIGLLIAGAASSGASAQQSSRYVSPQAKAALKALRGKAARDWRPSEAGLEKYLVAVSSPVRTDLTETPTPRCAGVLISPTHVLTSAFCVGDAKDEATAVAPSAVEVYFGRRLDAASRSVKVKAVTVHPDFDYLSFKADLAVLTLAAPVPGTTPLAIAPASFAQAPARTVTWAPEDGADRMIVVSMATPPVAHDRCESAVRQVRLREAQDDYVKLSTALLLPPDAAQAAWKTILAAVPTFLTPQMHCGGPQEGYPCDTDGGSVLLSTPASGTTQLAAMLTANPACNTPGVPAIFTSVAPYADWIKSVVTK